MSNEEQMELEIHVSWLFPKDIDEAKDDPESKQSY